MPAKGGHRGPGTPPWSPGTPLWAPRDPAQAPRDPPRHPETGIGGHPGPEARGPHSSNISAPGPKAPEACLVAA